MMSKFKKSQVLMLFLLAALVFITPLLSSSLRPAYLYLVINLLIIAVGAEAGLLSGSFSKPPVAAHDHHQDKIIIKQNHNISNSNFIAPKTLNPLEAEVASSPPDHQQAKENIAPPCNNNEKKSPKVMEKSASEKIVVGAIKINKVKKCPSTPSLFFIGGGGDQWTELAAEEEDHVFAKEYNYQEEEEEEEVEGISGQELFTKAEMFIGNFYKQLKMQREESWKKIHGFYQKAF